MRVLKFELTFYNFKTCTPNEIDTVNYFIGSFNMRKYQRLKAEINLWARNLLKIHLIFLQECILCKGPLAVLSCIIIKLSL